MSGPSKCLHPAGWERRGVNGWASRIDVPEHDKPAVIVNPAASAGALLAWALGQIEQVNAVLEAVATGSTKGGMSTAELAGAVQHFNEQARAVLAALHEREVDASPPSSSA